MGLKTPSEDEILHGGIELFKGSYGNLLLVSPQIRLSTIHI